MINFQTKIMLLIHRSKSSFLLSLTLIWFGCNFICYLWPVQQAYWGIFLVQKSQIGDKQIKMFPFSTKISIKKPKTYPLFHLAYLASISFLTSSARSFAIFSSSSLSFSRPRILVFAPRPETSELSCKRIEKKIRNKI